MMEANPNLDPFQIKEILKQNKERKNVVPSDIIDKQIQKYKYLF